jgi:hypothetical protein
MAAVTAGGTAVLGLVSGVGGIAANATQAFKQNKEMKKNAELSKKASQELKAINEQNAFKQMQVPTLGTQLAQQSQAQRETQTMNMLQGAGAEGVIGGVGQLAMAGNQSDLQQAVNLDQMKFERDAMQAQAQQGINSRKQQRDFEIGFGEKLDAEARRAQAEENKNAAITGLFESAGQALTSGFDLAGLYKNKNKSTNTASLPAMDWNQPFTEQMANLGAYGPLLNP